jgi:hypothetical protein
VSNGTVEHSEAPAPQLLARPADISRNLGAVDPGVTWRRQSPTPNRTGRSPFMQYLYRSLASTALVLLRDFPRSVKARKERNLLSNIESTTPGGFPASDGPVIRARDIRAEEEVLEEILGSLDDRRARFDAEVLAEITAAIDRLGMDWGRPAYLGQLDETGRAELISSALADPSARAVVTGYLAHLQEHRAEFLSKLLHPDTA